MKKIIILCFLLSIITSAELVQATPSQYGVTGLITVPTADTLDSGNIAVGLWVNTSKNGRDKPTVVPVSLTLGLGTFMEAYGSFPNLLFNDNEFESGRGFADLGIKVRVLGKRSSSFQFSLDAQARRHIDKQLSRDGLTDLVGRGIASVKTSNFGLHLNAGYLQNDNKKNIDNQIVGGLGAEFYPMARLRILAEFDGATKALSTLKPPLETLFGFQYFISPHLTFNSSYGVGLTDSANDWRVIVGLSTSQGIGTYTKPVPRIIEPPVEKSKLEPVKKAKFKALTPLVPKKKILEADPVAKLEIPVDPGLETVIVDPSDLLVVPGTAAIMGAPASPISTPVPATPTVTEVPAGQAPEFQTKGPIETVVYRKFRFDELNYGFDQSSLTESGKRAVALVADKLRKESKKFILLVNGHTDSTGSEDYNEKLSYKRAVSVGIWLVSHEGFDPSRIFIKGVGEDDPIADNSTPEGRSLNRRSEILVLLPKN
ncbi:OmpA family protein [Geopsychrobacter electrodiphilus]|uniref:OmpA family protein n=1 Tax=Geopsychrobacter electrodiphilus TaxID=225196 RepID=UPI0004774E37|nr:OmpA family protein [Geopsychrobacter electrodiphilus]